MKFRFVLLIALLLSAGLPLNAQDTNTKESETTIRTDSAGRVLVPEMSEQAKRYFRSGNRLWVLNVLLGILIPSLWLFTGFSARIRSFAHRIGRKWFFVIALYFVIFTIISYVIDFPLSYYQDFVRPHEYGLSNQTFAKWISDSLKSLMVVLIIGILFLWIPFLLLKKSPKRWWLYTSLLAIPFLSFVVLISPIWIDPLFNDFGPMKNKGLEAKILAVAERAGIEGSDVYEVNKSADTKTLNAYVTGFGNTKRIVLWDTIIAKLSERELLTVMGHEMGHYVLGHVIKGILFFSLLILVTLYLAYRLAGGLIRRFQHQFGFAELSDVASLPLLLLLINLFSLIIMPVAFTFTRYQEHESDRFALEITRDNYAAAAAFVKLQQQNLGNPRPGLLYKLWRASHPTLGERIDFCNEYRPWEEGKPLKYGHIFQ